MVHSQALFHFQIQGAKGLWSGEGLIIIIIIRTWGISKIASRYITKIYSHEKELLNKKVFSCLLNTVNESAEVTLGGRLFHT